MPNLGGFVFLLRTRWQLQCITWLDEFEKKRVHMLLTLSKRVNILFFFLMSLFWGWRTSSRSHKKKPPYIWEQLICQAQNILWQSFQLSQVYGMAKMVMKPFFSFLFKTKQNKKFSLVAPWWKPCSYMSTNLANVIRLKSNTATMSLKTKGRKKGFQNQKMVRWSTMSKVIVCGMAKTVMKTSSSSSSSFLKVLCSCPPYESHVHHI